MADALAGVRVLDFTTTIAGPHCTRLMADLGAEVIKIEAPDGELMRSRPPLRDGASAVFAHLNAGKKSVVLDLKKPAAIAAVKRLVAGADAVVENFRPGVMRRLGLDYESLKPIKPDLIYCAISGYGQDGPYRDRVGHDVNYLGVAGVLHHIGHGDGAPVIPGVQIADIGAGALMAVIGILSAVIARQQTGRGQFVDIAMLDGAALWNVYPVLLHQLGQGPERGRTQLTGHHPCYAVYETRDGRYVTVGAYEPHFWATLCHSLGHPEFIDRQWADGAEREHMLATLRAIFRTRTQAEWLAELGEKEICFGPVNDVAQMLADPQLRHRGMVVDQPGGPPTLGNPIRLSDTPPTLRTPPPRFGQHTEEVLRGLGLDAAAIDGLRADGVIG
jgi:crotonobetainyl-CoA:carnitine CoA-transferase CaiB-like acyl-CoA transferase